MQCYQFIASSYPLKELNSKQLVLLSSREVQERNLTAGEISETFSTTDPNEKNFLYFGGSDEANDELEITPDDPTIYARTYTEKAFVSKIQGAYSSEMADQLIRYIREHIEETRAFEVELWTIHTNDTQSAKMKTTYIGDLTTESIESLLACRTMDSPEGLIISAE